MLSKKSAFPSYAQQEKYSCIEGASYQLSFLLVCSKLHILNIQVIRIFLDFVFLLVRRMVRAFTIVLLLRLLHNKSGYVGSEIFLTIVLAALPPARAGNLFPRQLEDVGFPPSLPCNSRPERRTKAGKQ
jgi:hypothetical protein